MDDGCLEIVFIFFAVIVGIGLAIWIVIATFFESWLGLSSTGVAPSSLLLLSA